MSKNEAERYGVMCEAAFRYDQQTSPRYISESKEIAEKYIPEMNRECASRARHYVVKMEKDGSWKEVK